MPPQQYTYTNYTIYLQRYSIFQASHLIRKLIMKPTYQDLKYTLSFPIYTFIRKFKELLYIHIEIPDIFLCTTSHKHSRRLFNEYIKLFSNSTHHAPSVLRRRLFCFPIPHSIQRIPDPGLVLKTRPLRCVQTNKTK